MFPFLRKNSVVIVLFVCLVGIYIHNLSRSVYAGDVGDLVTAAYVGGVAHPPGYPLFTLLGFLLTRFSFGQPPAFLVGLISAFSAAGAATIVYVMIRYFTKNKIVSILTSLILAFSYLFWLYAEIAEVFALHIFLTLLLLFLATLYYKTKRLSYLYAVAFFAGLSLTHHHTIVLIFPSLFLLVIGNLWGVFKKRKQILLYLLGFLLLGFSIYLYIPIASAQNPPINWERVNDVDSFMQLLLRKSYGTFRAGTFAPPSFDQRMVILKTYGEMLVAQLTPIVSLICAIGIGVLIKKQRLLGGALLLAFLLSGPLFIVYAAFPLDNAFYLGISERFFLMSFAIYILFFPFGLLFIEQVLQRIFIRDIYRHLFEIVFFIIPLMLFIYNFPKTNLSTLMDGDYLGYDILATAPKNAVVFVSGDTPVFNVWYAHYALGVRPDVDIININIPTDRYFLHEMELYKQAFPQRKNDKNLTVQVLRHIAGKRPVTSLMPLSFLAKPTQQWVPYGLTVELVNTLTISENEFTKKTEETYGSLQFLKTNQQKTFVRDNFTIMDIPESYANAYVMTGTYYLEKYENMEKAEEYFLKAKAMAPEFVKPYAALGLYHLYYTRNCMEAKENFMQAIERSSTDKRLYTLLYATYAQCLEDAEGAKNVVKLFNTRFQSDFFAELNKSVKEQKKQ